MGLNLIRWVSDPHYRSFKRWKWAAGDRTLRFDYPLSGTSIVVDAGAYIGDFAREIADRTGATVHAFEPIAEFAEIARKELAHRPRTHVHTFGLSDHDHTASITLDGDASSTLRSAAQSVTAQFRDVTAVLDDLGLQQVDLMKINVEGGEYAILPRLMETGAIRRIRDIQVQFHLLDGESRARYQRIASGLAATHRLTWRYPFIWENWRLIDTASAHTPRA
jgi:FkbM family methyltransferase